MRSLLLPALMALLSAPPAAAFPARPPEVPDRSENWGPDPQGRAARIFRCLLRASGLDGEKALAREGRRPTELRLTDKYAVVEGSPALALMARTGPNAEDRHIVLGTFGLFEFNDEDQLAFIFAHELSHLALEHPKRAIEKMQEFAAARFDAWYEGKKSSLTSKPAEEVAALFVKEHEGELSKISVAFEREADGDGYNLMGQANRHCEEPGVPASGYDRAGAAESMARAEKWLKARHMGGVDLAHDPLLTRSATLARYRQESEASASRARAAMGARASE